MKDIADILKSLQLAYAVHIENGGEASFESAYRKSRAFAAAWEAFSDAHSND